MQQGIGDDDDDDGDDDDGDDDDNDDDDGDDDDLICYTLYHNEEKGEWERVRSELIRRREAAEKAQEELEVKTHIFIFLFGAPIDPNLTN